MFRSVAIALALGFAMGTVNAAGVVFGTQENGGGSGDIRSYDATTGNLISEFGGVITEGGLVYGDGKIFGVSSAYSAREIVGYDVTTGAMLSRFGSSDGDLAYGNGVVYGIKENGGGSGTIRGYDATTGNLISELGGVITKGGLVYGDGKIFGMSHYGPSGIVSYDVTTGARVNLFAASDGGLAYAPVVPIPPAIYLFGSALGLMGWMRRKVSC
jgi:WD40 repeat protein